jgi:hypothetical protein
MFDENNDYGYFIDIDFDIDKIHNPITNNSIINKKHDDVIISENSIETQYIIIVNFCCFCLVTLVYIYVSPPFK